MAIFLDSASTADATRAMGLGFISGITTNPTLMARIGRNPLHVIAELADICPGTVFYQLTASTVTERHLEADRILALRPNIGLKIPMNTENLPLAAEFARAGVRVGMTATYSPAQTYLTCEAGIDYTIAYVNRSTRLQGDGLALVGGMRSIVDACATRTTIMVASLKSPGEVVHAVNAGAHHVTVPLDLLLEMGEHPLSTQTVEEFARAAAATTASPQSH
ncbi:MAG: transaldolase family protein [Methylotetracoccus sp.]